MTDYKTLKIINGTALIEYEEDGVGKRVLLPVEMLEHLREQPDLLDMAVSYGVDWVDVLKCADIRGLDQEKFANAMHKRGVWTKADVISKPISIRDSLVDALGGNVQSILREIRKLKE